jgi:hypothetical protein
MSIPGLQIRHDPEDDRHLPKVGGGAGGTACLTICAWARLTCAAWRTDEMYWPTNAKSINITLIMMRNEMARKLAAVSLPANVSLPILKLVELGSSVTKRAEIVLQFRYPTGTSGSAEINAVNLSIALSRDNRLKSAASFHGSTSTRASAERTLNSGSSAPSSTDAYKNWSNSDRI